MSSLRKPLTDLLQAFGAIYGPPSTGDLKTLSALWHLVCEDFTDEQITRATKGVLKKKSFGWPKPSDLAEVIEGRIVKVKEYARDLENCRYREKLGGPLVVEAWHEIRVPHDWRGDAGELDFDDLPAEVRAFQIQARQEQLQIGD